MLIYLTRAFVAAFVLGICLTASELRAQATVDLSDSPVLASGRGPASNLLLSLSVEFPTVGAAYRVTTYNNNLITLGYWDSDSCYLYITAGVPASLGANQPATGAPAGYFKRSRAAVSRQCGGVGEYSGNFMNWAALSAIDSLRYALTGGDRIYETTSQTILQRADIPTDYYNGSYFPGKSATNANLYTPFAGTVFIASCRYVIYIGTATGGSCGAAGTNGNLAVLRAAVDVCDSIEGPVRSDLCRLQPSGFYKPTGLMQQYSDTIRFAAFGYALDSGNARYGGVLRAPMKYVGKYSYDSAFNKITNPAPEWDSVTGIYNAAPLTLQAGTTYSGVANYLNRFGRVTQSGTALTTALGSATMYKGNDPVSELYYEGLRYIQGQAASPQVTATPFTAPMYDGFPIYTNWLSTAVPDPITSACQSTSIIQIADAFTHNDKTLPGNSRTDGSGDSARGVGVGEPNVVTWTNTVGAFELANPPPNPLAPATLASLGTANTGSSSASFYISGLAYWANTQSIRADKPNIRVKTYVVDVDENGNGTVTSRERNRQLYLAAKYGGFDNLNNDGSPFTIPPSGAAATTKWASGVDDNGWPLPKTFFLASSPQKMINSLRAAFASIARSTGTLAGGSVSGTRVSSTGTDAYVSRLDAQNDAGTVVSFALTLNTTTGAVTVANAPTWNAADQLTGNVGQGIPAKSPGSRNIITTQTDGTPIGLQWASLDTAQQALFNKDPDSGVVDGLGARRVSYLRGSRVDEVSKGTAASPLPFRDRTSLVASIVNSAPIYVGSKPGSTLSGTSFATFYRNMNRTPVVYVGTNDGVLHAFSAANGGELFAFVPRALVNKLPATTSPNFVRQPMFDAPPVIGEAQIAFTGAASDWRSILVSGYGGGSQGVFALNVTDPAAFSANTASVLWDFSDADDPKMGNLTSAARILKFRTGANSFKWFVVVPSGYNNNKVDTPPLTLPLRHDTSNQSALFLLDVAKPNSTPWTLGSNYYRIDLPTSFQDSSKANALLSPGAALGTDGEVLTLYGGDIQGNLWKFDFSTVVPPYTASNVLAFGGASGKPIFTAADNSGNRQPITIEPVVGAGPGRSNIIVFGTGKFVEATDTVSANYKQQAMYGIWDDLTNTNASRTGGLSELAQRTASGTGTTFSVTGSGFDYGYPTSGSKKKGWYFNYPGTSNGERQATNLAVSNSYVYFNTLAAVTPSATACAAYGGRQCAVNGANGLSNGTTCDLSSDGFLPAPNILQPDVDNRTSTSGQGFAVQTTTPLVLTFVGTPVDGSGNVSAGKPLGKLGVTTKQQLNRLSWREIVDYDKLKAAYP